MYGDDLYGERAANDIMRHHNDEVPIALDALHGVSSHLRGSGTRRYMHLLPGLAVCAFNDPMLGTHFEDFYLYLSRHRGKSGKSTHGAVL